jgi:hypothetical protein
MFTAQKILLQNSDVKYRFKNGPPNQSGSGFIPMEGIVRNRARKDCRNANSSGSLFASTLKDDDAVRDC